MLQGRYHIDQEIGTGAHGKVYRGLDLHTNTPVAIKHLRPDVVQHDPDILKRFQREAQALRRLNHPNIVQILDTFAEANEHYIVMEYLSGGSLRALLDNMSRPPLEDVLRMMLDLSDALIRAHRLEIIHRDLKPANIMLAADGTPRLTDFGVALVHDQERITDSRAFVGTLNYIAPETLNGDPPSTSADIWAFGVMLYEMLAGRRPFENPTSTGLIVAILTQTPDELEAHRPETPLALTDLVYRMLDKNPRARISSMRRVGAELEALLQQLLSGNALVPMVVSTRPIPTANKIDGQPQPRRKHNLPAQTTPFIGRNWEMEELLRLLRPSAETGRPRLITLLGPGGMGKSRLSLEVAAKLLEPQTGTLLYPDGIYFVALAPVMSPDRIPNAIADVVGYSMPNDGREPMQQLELLLSEQHMLLILDNFEHLMAGVEAVTRFLGAAPGLTILVTSRERLNLSAEHLFALEGLQTPTLSGSTSPMEYSAIRLFVQSAQRIQPQFKLEMADVPHLAAICRLVGGLPLALMLAATWAEMLTPKEIAAELTRSADFLEASMQDLPERHRSMRAVFDYSWQRLSEGEQKTLAQLSIFRGPFSRVAAQAVTRASLRDLMQLVNKSLLYRDSDTGYYDLHELIRQFAERQLTEDETAYQAAIQVHSRYYCTWLKELLPIMDGPLLPALQAMDAEIDNIRQAWQSAIARKDMEALDSAERAFAVYYYLRGLDGQLIYELLPALAMLEALSPAPYRDKVLGRIYSYLGFVYPPLVNYDKALNNLERSLQLLRGINDEIGICRALYYLSTMFNNDSETYAQEALVLAQKHRLIITEVLLDIFFANHHIFYTKQFDTAFDWAQKALTQSIRLQQAHCHGLSLYAMAQIHFHMQKPQLALVALQDARTYLETADNWTAIVDCLQLLGDISRYLGNYEQALANLQEAVAIAIDRGFFDETLLLYRFCGDLAGLLERYDDALQYYADALKAAQLPGPAFHSLHIPLILLAQAEIFLSQGRFDEFEIHLQQAESITQPYGNETLSLHLHVGLVRGQWHQAKGRLTEAEGEYYKALQDSLPTLDDHLLIVVLGFLMQIYAQQEYFHKAGLIASLIQGRPFLGYKERQRAFTVLKAVRPHLSDTEWAKIEIEVAATTLKEYAESLVKDASDSPGVTG